MRYSKLVSIVSLLWVSQSCCEALNVFQKLFGIQSANSHSELVFLGHDYVNANLANDVHYSELHASDWPIELTQYTTDMVIRVNFSENKKFKEYLLLNKHQKESREEGDILFKVWAKSETNSYIDLQIDEVNFIALIEKFSTKERELSYEVVIEDLAQKIFETYPAPTAKSDDFDEDNIRTLAQSAAYNKWTAKSSVQNEELERAYTAAQQDPSMVNMLTYSELFFKDYRPLDSIEAWLDLLVQTFPDLLSIEVIGSTYEHRTYKVIHFLANPPDDGSDHERKKTVVITGGVHAREWISVSSVCYTMYEMLQYYTEHPEEHSMLDQLDFLFIPVLNPDGYVYSWLHDRLWRKNRQETTYPKCFGIDIDHSYDYHWTKLSDWPCGEEYLGEVPFEAIELRIWEEFLNATNDNHEIHGYIDLHSYSQEILYPYAFSCQQLPRDEENLIELAYGISKAIRLQSGKNYQVLPACVDKDLDLLPDLGSGSALDYMYHHKAYWAYQLKLRDSGSHGFLLPGKYIEPVGKEVYAGIRYFCSFILRDD